MKFHVLTLFPEIPKAFFESSIMAKAVEKGIIAYDLVNIRDFAFDKHKTCDDNPYGGGAGMLMLPETLGAALDSVESWKKRVVYVTPSGKPLTQKLAQELSQETDLVLICGRYEGIDQRIIDSRVDDEISIGDYVLTGGELAALVMIDAIARFVPGVLHNDESARTDSFQDGLLEYPQYSRPEVWNGKRVPEVLLSGDHARVDRWRLEQSIERTRLRRPELYEAWVKNH